MKKRPLAIRFYSILLMLMVLSMPFQAIYIAESFDISDWIIHITGLNIIMAASLICASVCAYRGSKKIYLFAPLALMLVLINNYWVGYVGLQLNLWQTTLSSIGFLFVSVALLDKKARAVFQTANVQWWRAAPRKKIRLSVSLHPWVGESVVAQTHDISLTGAFIQLPSDQFKVGDRMQVRLNIAGYKDVRCTARLVRKAAAAGTYPTGFGIQFEELGKNQRILLEHLVEPTLS